MAGVALHFADQRQGIRPVYPGGPGREVLVSCAFQVGTVLDATYRTYSRVHCVGRTQMPKCGRSLFVVVSVPEGLLCHSNVIRNCKRNIAFDTSNSFTRVLLR